MSEVPFTGGPRIKLFSGISFRVQAA
ncbi:TPA: hypothetical protein ACGSMI_001950, partial [Escherichia coli]|nr:hypothetical protein [Escherichia coli]